MNYISLTFVFKPMRLTTFITIIISFLFISYGAKGQSSDVFPYDLSTPHQVHFLPEILEEISGLTYYAPNQLAALNDEHGRMYVYHLEQKAIVHRVRFEGNGDFEGIERVGDYIYAVKSNGNLYRFNVNMTGVVEKIETPFSSENNVEGLGYDPNTGHLLFALKEKGDLKNVEVKGKSIFGYHLETKEHTNTPLFVLQNKELARVLGSTRKKVKPSGVAVHPTNGDIYVVAAVGRALVVFGSDGKPKNLSILKAGLFPQPEGITFSPEGDLFISNEVEGEGGTIVHFKMKSR